ncbi:hypothetical protein LXL04_011156 [Taraxacum kok-saghyz]
MEIMAEGLERRRKRVRSSTDMPVGYKYNDNEENDDDEINPKKFMQLIKKNTKQFRRVKKSKKPKKRQTTEKKKSKQVPIVSNEVTQRLKEYIVNEKNGTEVKVLIQKTLFKSDLKKSQNRLNMPIKQLETLDFLKEHEKQLIHEKEKGLKVKLLGPRLREHKEYSMVLKIWHLKSTENYVLITNWNDFVKENQKDLKKDTMIQVWSFRIKDKLHFAIACLEMDISDAPAPISDSLLPPKKRLRFLW